MKLIQQFTNANAQVRIHWNASLGEYRCRVYKVSGFNFKAYTPEDYFTDDKTDAINTARLMIQAHA